MGRTREGRGGGENGMVKRMTRMVGRRRGFSGRGDKRGKKIKAGESQGK